VSILKTYVVFECLACNLLQISLLKLCFEKLRFLKKCIFRMQELLFHKPKFSCAGVCPQTSLANLCLRHSPHNFGDHLLPWGRSQGKLALWQFCPTTEESLKNALSSTVTLSVQHFCCLNIFVP
jgi:hypothetical protein